MGEILLWLKRKYHRMVARLVAQILRPEAVYDPYNFDIWERRGYHITPAHFHYPIPDTRELRRRYPAGASATRIDMRPESQLTFLQESFPRFSEEYNLLPLKSSNPEEFYLYNDGFCGIDPHVYYSMIRYSRPMTVIEVGSGHSTLLGHQALAANGNGGELIVVDPWPRDFTLEFMANCGPGLTHIDCKAEELDPSFYQRLEESDILFVDSSHVVRTGGEVCFLMLEVIPRLPSGVIIHFHDIYLPYDYPKERVLNGHMFWTEQYLLQAYLTENEKVEVMFASNYASRQFPEAVKTAFPKALWWSGESFWIRKL